MIFGLGPVVRFELITTARRRRYYVARVVYGALLLVLLWSDFQVWESRFPGGGKRDELRQFAESAFIRFAGAQGLMLLLLVPALIAGVIADEYQRKTLHYLLASRLTSLEIVLGKLGARLWNLAMFVALGLPIVALVGLYGGLNPQYVFHVYVGTFTTVLLVACGSILISTVSNRPRDAILMAYGLEAFWLIGPLWIRDFANGLTGPLFWVEAVAEAMIMTNPLYVWMELTGRALSPYNRGYLTGWVFRDFQSMSYTMAGLQAALGLGFLAVTIAVLRPLRGSSWPGAAPKTGWWTRLRARLRAWEQSRAATALATNELLATRISRPPCGDDPMYWKERHTTLGGGLRVIGGRPMSLFLAVLLGCYLFDVAYPVVKGMMLGADIERARLGMNSAIRGASTALALLGFLVVGSSAAVSLTAEREGDTWISLATTLLAPSEIVHAKQFGALWSARRIWLALLILWSAGTILGAIHPVGMLTACSLVAALAWLIAATGVLVSARAKNSTRALMLTLVFLFLVVFWTQDLLWASVLSYPELAALRGDPEFDGTTTTIGQAVIHYAILAGAAQIAIAVLFSHYASRRLRATWGLA